MKRATALYLIERRLRIRKCLYALIAIWAVCIAVAMTLE
jgi:hypothetical protein